MKLKIMNIAEIKENVALLPAQDRASLAQWILTNLDIATEKDDDIAWRQEVRLRVEEVKTGKVEMIDSHEMWNELLSSYEC